MPIAITIYLHDQLSPVCTYSSNIVWKLYLDVWEIWNWEIWNMSWKPDIWLFFPAWFICLYLFIFICFASSLLRLPLLSSSESCCSMSWAMCGCSVCSLLRRAGCFGSSQALSECRYLFLQSPCLWREEWLRVRFFSPFTQTHTFVLGISAVQPAIEQCNDCNLYSFNACHRHFSTHFVISTFASSVKSFLELICHLCSLSPHFCWEYLLS